MAEYLVTGGTSFIASHVIKTLLEFGQDVRTTVRDSGTLPRFLTKILRFCSNGFLFLIILGLFLVVKQEMKKRTLVFYGS